MSPIVLTRGDIVVAAFPFTNLSGQSGVLRSCLMKILNTVM